MKCVCGSTDVIRYGIRILRTGKYQTYCCKKCGRRFEDKSKKIGDNMLYKKKEDNRKYHREYYQRTPRQQEIVKAYGKLRKIKKSVEQIKDMILVKTAKPTGHSAYLTLPKSWLNKEVLVIDVKLFEKDIRKSRV